MSQSESGASKFGLWMLLAALVLGGSLMVSASFIQRGYVESKDVSNMNVASVNGVAEAYVDSDKAKWSVQISRNGGSSVEQTVKDMKEDEKAFRALLDKAGIKDPTVSVQPATVLPGENYSNQVIVVETKNVSALSAVSQIASSELSKRNASLSSNSIEYFYSDMINLQKTLTKQALEDAKTQAKEVLGLASPRIQTVGYTQLIVSPESSSMYGGYGQTDTTSIRKKVSVSVSVGFFLEK